MAARGLISYLGLPDAHGEASPETLAAAGATVPGLKTQQ